MVCVVPSVKIGSNFKQQDRNISQQNNFVNIPETVLPSLAECGHKENLVEGCLHTAPVFVNPGEMIQTLHVLLLTYT